MTGLFITGTDTNVGKTHVAVELLRAAQATGKRAGAYKPACSGAVWNEAAQSHIWEDVQRLSAAIGDRFPQDWICPQRFLAPLAPPTAATQEGRAVDAALLRSGVRIWGEHVELLVVEGAGGWLSPLSEEDTNADLAVDLNFPVLIVAANRLGAINHTLLTVESVRSRGLKVAGVVLNSQQASDDQSVPTNLRDLQNWCDCPVFGPVPFAVQQSEEVSNRFNWIETFTRLQLG